VTSIASTSGAAKKFVHMSSVITTKHNANAHRMVASCARVPSVRRPSSNASSAENRRKAVEKIPKPEKKLQYVRSNPCTMK